MAEIALPLMAAGTLISASGTLAAGAAAERASQHQAVQLTQQATAERASAAAASAEERRKATLVQSRARALMAASGSDVDANILGDIEAEGEFRALSALWEGDERAAGARAQASATRFEGKSRRQASRIQAFGTLLSGGASLAEKYG